MNKEEAVKELRCLLESDCNGLYYSEIEALQYAIHFLESAEEVEINKK